jgi:ribosomal protein L11 methyltransferase
MSAQSAAGWTAVRVVPGDARDALLAVLFAAGSQGVHEEGEALVTHFPPGTDAGGVRHALLAADAGARVDLSPADATDWSEAWKSRVRAHRLGGLVISPPWLAHEHDPATTIVIDPGMAFGTGEHATTRGVVRLMQGVVRPGDVVADLGAGSAVLAIAAAKLGASRVAAIELDPDAIENAEENVERNGVRHAVTVIEGDAGVLVGLVAPVQLVLANIISSALVELWPAIDAAVAPGGRAIVSGILQEERTAMVAALASLGWAPLAEDAEDVWWSALVGRT